MTELCQVKKAGSVSETLNRADAALEGTRTSTYSSSQTCSKQLSPVLGGVVKQHRGTNLPWQTSAARDVHWV